MVESKLQSPSNSRRVENGDVAGAREMLAAANEALSAYARLEELK